MSEIGGIRLYNPLRDRDDFSNERQDDPHNESTIWGIGRSKRPSTYSLYDNKEEKEEKNPIVKFLEKKQDTGKVKEAIEVSHEKAETSLEKAKKEVQEKIEKIKKPENAKKLTMEEILNLVGPPENAPMTGVSGMYDFSGMPNLSSLTGLSSLAGPSGFMSGHNSGMSSPLPGYGFSSAGNDVRMAEQFGSSMVNKILFGYQIPDIPTA